MIWTPSFFRKVIYLACMVPLLMLIAWLGMPGEVDPTSGVDARLKNGGHIAYLRAEYNLSKSDLGEIDPASETMRLAMFGLEGPATTLLWEQADEYKKTKEYDKLSMTLEQISRLQPNFLGVWEYQAHNMAYNVSAEFDDYRLRYHWVKKGTEFQMKGTLYNQREEKLLRDCGWFVSQKFGRADEKDQFRRMFRIDDPFHRVVAAYLGLLSFRDVENDDITAPLPEHGYDPLFDRPDNWLVGRLWYLKAERLVDSENVFIHGESPALFYSRAPKCWINCAEAIDKEVDLPGEQDELDLAGSIDPFERNREIIARLERMANERQRASGAAWSTSEEQWAVNVGEQPLYSGGRSFHLMEYEQKMDEVNENVLRLDLYAAGIDAGEVDFDDLRKQAGDELHAENLAEMAVQRMAATAAGEPWRGLGTVYRFPVTHSDLVQYLKQQYASFGEARQQLADKKKEELSPQERSALELTAKGETSDPDVIQLAMAAENSLQVQDKDLVELAPEQFRDDMREVLKKSAELRADVQRMGTAYTVINFGYWLKRCRSERTPEASAAKKHLYLARQLYAVHGDPTRAKQEFEAAWKDLAEVMARYPEIAEFVAEAQTLVEAIVEYQRLLNDLDEEFRLADFPMQQFFVQYQEMVREEQARAELRDAAGNKE